MTKTIIIRDKNDGVERNFNTDAWTSIDAMIDLINAGYEDISLLTGGTIVKSGDVYAGASPIADRPSQSEDRRLAKYRDAEK